MVSGTQTNAGFSGAALRVLTWTQVNLAEGSNWWPSGLTSPPDWVWLAQCFRRNVIRAVHLQGHACSTPILTASDCPMASWPLVFTLLLDPWRWLVLQLLSKSYVRSSNCVPPGVHMTSRDVQLHIFLKESISRFKVSNLYVYSLKNRTACEQVYGLLVLSSPRSCHDCFSLI